MPWASRRLRGERVFVKVAPDGRPLAAGDGRVDIVYKPGGKVYRASLRNLDDDPQPEMLADTPTEGPPAPRSGVGQPSRSPVPADAVIVYTDGACTGNPGPMGLGVVILDGRERRELSEYLGHGTNNIAELTAIVRALELAPKERTVVVHSDSSYALGLLGKGWKAKANQELVERMRALAAGFHDLRLVKVAGHAGVAENERCDQLARDAVMRRK